MVDIKDDPEVLPSTSIVNPGEVRQEFEVEDYQESYDGYYEDDTHVFYFGNSQVFFKHYISLISFNYNN